MSGLSRSEFRFESKDLLGTGSYSCVYKGECRGTVCAIKKCTVPLDTQILEDVRREVTALRDNPHPNIVMCMGVCVEGDDVFVVTEFCGGGTLDDLLHEQVDLFLPVYQTLNLASQVAKGLAWIHGAGYLHRDLKPANVFLTDSNYARCKIGDLGFAIKGEGRHDGKGSGLWLAPEKMRQENETFKSDVYSLAIIVWECLTRLEPFAEYEDPAEFATAVCEQRVRPLIPPGTPQSLASLLTAAWHDDPQQRPDAHAICLDFPGIIIDVTIEDRVGREFWRKHFSNEFAAPVDPFFSNFFSFISYPQNIPNDPVLDYLTASLDPVQSDTITAYEFAGFLRWFGPLHPDTSVITFMKSVFDKEWFWSDLSTKDAAMYLSGQPEGTFLIRFSSQRNGSYTISWTRRQKISHSRITYEPSSGTYITPTGKSFASLDAWVIEAGVRQPLKEPGQISRFRQAFSQPVYEDLSAPLPQFRSVDTAPTRQFQPARFRVVVDDDSATSSSSDSED